MVSEGFFVSSEKEIHELKITRLSSIINARALLPPEFFQNLPMAFGIEVGKGVVKKDAFSALKICSWRLHIAPVPRRCSGGIAHFSEWNYCPGCFHIPQRFTWEVAACDAAKFSPVSP